MVEPEKREQEFRVDVGALKETTRPETLRTDYTRFYFAFSELAHSAGRLPNSLRARVILYKDEWTRRPVEARIEGSRRARTVCYDRTQMVYLIASTPVPTMAFRERHHDKTHSDGAPEALRHSTSQPLGSQKKEKRRRVKRLAAPNPDRTHRRSLLKCAHGSARRWSDVLGGVIAIYIGMGGDERHQVDIYLPY